MQDGIETTGKLLARGDLIRDARIANLGLRANDSLSNGAWRREVRVRDLFSCQAAHFAQRQRDLGIGRKCRVATRENEPEAIVITYVVRDKADRATVTITDISGATVATLKGSAEPGLNRVQWNMRRAGGGGGRGGGFGGGPLLAPGEYRVTVSVGSTQHVKIARIRERIR